MSGGVWGRDLPDVYAGDLSLCLQIKPNCPLTHPQLQRENTDPTPRPAHPRGSSETLRGGPVPNKEKKRGLSIKASLLSRDPYPARLVHNPDSVSPEVPGGKCGQELKTIPLPVCLGNYSGD